jgi:hypothetical protein
MLKGSHCTGFGAEERLGRKVHHFSHSLLSTDCSLTPPQEIVTFRTKDIFGLILIALKIWETDWKSTLNTQKPQ